MKRSIAFLLLILCASNRQLLAQQPGSDFSVERLGTHEGLSHRWTTCIHQDLQGYFWLGTYDGLNRYDGNEFIIYRPSDDGKFPVEADFVYQIAETAKGLIYISTLYGILSFDPKTGLFDLLVKINKLESVIVVNPGRGVPFLEAGISSWGTAISSLTIYDLLPSGQLVMLSKTSSLPNNSLFPVSCNKQNAWFWDYQGAYHRFDLKTSTWSRFPVTGSPEAPIDPSGNLWLPEHATLQSFILPQHAKSFNWEAAFNIEPDKAVWLYARTGKGICTLLRYDLKAGKLETAIPALNNSDFIKYRKVQTFRPSQFQDAEGTVWYAGFLGLYKVRRTGKLFQHYLSQPVQRFEAPPSGVSARRMIEDADGNIYLLDSEFNIYQLNIATDPSQKEKQAPSGAGNHHQGISSRFSQAFTNQVYAITESDDGFLWAYTHQGLLRYDPAGGQSRYYQIQSQELFQVQNLFDDGRGKIWLPGWNVLYRLDKKTGEVEQTPGWGPGALAYAVMLPEENTLWGFSSTGLIKINTLNLQSQHIKLYDKPCEQRCLVSHRGRLWVGTSRGLEKIDPQTFAHTNFDRSKGLPGNFVYSMVADGDYLWLGTSDGLCRFHVETGDVKNYFVEDGLSHNEFNTFSALKTRNGRILMGGLNGVNAFFSADLEGKTNAKSRILLSRFSQFDSQKDSLVFLSPDDLSGGIKLPPSISSFNFHLALTSYIDPGKNQYAWRMDGLDEDWYYAGNQHIATYHHIPPGSYTFRAKAADSFGNWSVEELALRVMVLRPWYSRWWAWLLYGLFVLGAIFSLYRFQLSKKIEHAERLRLQELDAFKTRFFTNITHEFRTPLTVILGMTEQLAADRERSPVGDIKSKLGLIKRNGENLLRLINQILDLAKLETHTLSINYVQGDVLPYLRYISESLHSVANAQNVMLRVESSETKIIMDYDPERLLQIVYNLLSNAIKFTPSGGRVILRSALEHDPHQPMLKLSVTDNGVGIPPEEIPHIFDRFYQAQNLEKAKAGGTGIGLALTKELVTLLGGEIMVESYAGKGTTFTIILPLTQAASAVESQNFASPSLPPSPLLPLPPSPPLPPSFPQILLIEDNPDVVEYLSHCLGENYQLDYAYNGSAGIEKALEKSPDLILSDVMMPEKNGFEVCDFLKNDERTSHIPIVLLTAKADVESRIAGLRRGADAYLAKPFHQEELMVTLKNLLDLRLKLQAKYRELALERTSSPPLPPAHDLENDFLQKLRAIVETDLSDTSLDVDALCRKTGMSRTNLHNKLSALTGLSTTIFVRKIRLQKAKQLLETTEMNISEIAYAVGFNDPKFFSRVFSEEFGIPPSEVRKRL
ncbi:MAG: response regulator [Saprospiraceae bacterium]|nr:response regulator [Saprospiraceae bacterium]